MVAFGVLVFFLPESALHDRSSMHFCVTLFSHHYTTITAPLNGREVVVYVVIAFTNQDRDRTTIVASSDASNTLKRSKLAVK